MGNCGGCASAKERCGNGLEKIYPTTAVRYGRMRHIGEFSHAPDMQFTCGAKVVIATDRGMEIGEQVSLTCHGCEKSVNRDQMRDYAKASGGDTFRLKSGRILREATEDDLHEYKKMEDGAFEKLQTGRRLAGELDLPMKVVDCEHLFGGERIVFYFMADGRIDFRDLVRGLAGEFQTRIEMRQVGARDEARLLADYETCGRECCCKNFLKSLKPISMSMAKLQKTTLDLSKVSGRCGRLKCCLRYEHEGYGELEAKLPRIGVRVRTSHGDGDVVDRQILTQLVKIRTDDNKLMTVVLEDVLETNVPRPEGAVPRGGRDSEGNGRRGGREAGHRPRGGQAAAADETVHPATEDELAVLSDDSSGEAPPESGPGPAEGEVSPSGPQDQRDDGPDRPRGRRRRRGGRGRRPPGGGPGGGDGG